MLNWVEYEKKFNDLGAMQSWIIQWTTWWQLLYILIQTDVLIAFKVSWWFCPCLTEIWQKLQIEIPVTKLTEKKNLRVSEIDKIKFWKTDKRWKVHNTKSFFFFFRWWSVRKCSDSLLFISTDNQSELFSAVFSFLLNIQAWHFIQFFGDSLSVIWESILISC